MLLEQLAKLDEALRLDQGHSLGDVLELVSDEKAQIWEAPNAVLVTQVHEYPKGRVLHFWLAGGDLDEVVKLSHTAMDWGRSVGCVRATLTGRRGWKKVLAEQGWSEEATMLGRSL